MQISLFMLAEVAQRDKNDKMVVSSPILYFSLPAFPGNYSFSIVFGVTEIDISGQHDLMVKVMSPEGISLMNETILIPGNDLESTNEDGLSGIVASLDIRNFVFPEPGKYKFSFTIDGITSEKEYDVSRQTAPSRGIIWN